jgi:hypothetical protein
MVAVDDAGTLARLRTLRREIVEPLAAENSGRIFKATGDSLLAVQHGGRWAVACCANNGDGADAWSGRHCERKLSNGVATSLSHVSRVG